MKKSFLFIIYFAVLACSNDFEVVEKVDHASRVASENLYEITVDSTWNGMSFTQGNCSVSQAENNLTLLEHFIDFADSPDYDGLSIVGGFDCFFKIGNSSQQYPSATDGINLRSNFTFEMSNDTHLRVLTEDNPQNQLIGIFDQDNITIRGGNLHGDRQSYGDVDLKSDLLQIRSGRHITVDGTNFFDANGEGITVNSRYFAWQYEVHEPYPIHSDHQTLTQALGTESKFIDIVNCTFERNRGNNLSVTNGHDVNISNCTFRDASVTIGSSIGRGGGRAIDIEGSTRIRDEEGNINTPMIYYEHVYNVKIENCIESGSRLGAFNAGPCSNVLIQNNTTKNDIAIGIADNVVIRGNIIDRSNGAGVSSGVTGISVGQEELTNMTFSNQVINNTIIGFNVGMDLHQKYCDVIGNQITNCSTGIQMQNIEYYTIEKNIIINNSITNNNIIGIANLNSENGGNYLKDVKIENNTIDISNDYMASKPLYIYNTNMNEDERDFIISISGNKISGKKNISFNSVNGLHLVDNSIFTGISLLNCKRTKINANRIAQINGSSAAISIVGCNGTNISHNGIPFLNFSSNTLPLPNDSSSISNYSETDGVKIDSNIIYQYDTENDQKCIFVSRYNVHGIFYPSNHLIINNNQLYDVSDTIGTASIQIFYTTESIITHNTGKVINVPEQNWINRLLFIDNSTSNNIVKFDNLRSLYNGSYFIN